MFAIKTLSLHRTQLDLSQSRVKRSCHSWCKSLPTERMINVVALKAERLRILKFASVRATQSLGHKTNPIIERPERNRGY